MRWATEDDLEGTGAVTAPDETFMVKVGDDVGHCAAKFFRDKAHLRDVIEGLVSSGSRVWLYVPLHDCNYQHRTNEIVACLCLRGPEGPEPDIADEAIKPQKKLPRKDRPMYLIVPDNASPYMFKGRMTMAIKDKFGCSRNKLFKIVGGVASQLTMTGHFTEKDPWAWAEVPRKSDHLPV